MALLLFLHSGKRSELNSRLFFMPYRTERESSHVPAPLWGRGTGFPYECEGSSAFRRSGSKGSEGSKGGCGRLRRHHICRLRRRKPYNRPGGRGNAFPLWWLAPPPFRPAGKRVTGFSVAYSSLRIQFPCHRSSVGRQKESALMGRLGALLRPTWRSYAGPPQGTIKLRYAVSDL